MTVYAMLRRRRAVAHYADGDFQLPLCGRRAEMTSNVPWGKRICRDCIRIAATTQVVRIARTR